MKQDPFEMPHMVIKPVATQILPTWRMSVKKVLKVVLKAAFL